MSRALKTRLLQQRFIHIISLKMQIHSMLFKKQQNFSRISELWYLGKGSFCKKSQSNSLQHFYYTYKTISIILQLFVIGKVEYLVKNAI